MVESAGNKKDDFENERVAAFGTGKPRICISWAMARRKAPDSGVRVGRGLPWPVLVCQSLLVKCLVLERIFFRCASAKLCVDDPETSQRWRRRQSFFRVKHLPAEWES